MLTANNITIDINELQDYMFTSKNLIRFTKHIIQNAPNKSLFNVSNDPKREDTKIQENKKQDTKRQDNKKHNYDTCHTNNTKTNTNKTFEIYKPRQKDSLFWCFYILKHGYFNYEMEINNKYFVVEKSEKIKYVEMVRTNKELLKIHKIKPLTEIEDDLANKDKISIKTFLALCVLENINILLVDKRKIIELLTIDIDELHPIHVIHRNSKSGEHHIELNITQTILQNYRDNYYKMPGFDASLKSIGSYKLDELIELCNKLQININNNTNKKKQTKKDIYELLVLNY